MVVERWILVVDDDQHNREMLGEVLSRAGFQVEQASSGEIAIAKGSARDYDAVFSDIKMSPVSGLDVLEWFKKSAPETSVVLLTAFGSVETAIQAMKRGAFDYITKPFNLDEVELVATRAVEHCRLVRENRHLRNAFSEHPRATSIIGQSRNMVEVFKLIGKVAPSRTSVLIQGESGTGKDLIARAIHDNSPRAAGPFVPINCSAIPDTLIESELFGHAKGAFTGAHVFRRGLLEEASGGTCFLDEVGDMSIPGQAKLLRALQEQEIKRVGSNEPITVDLRVIAATHRDLKQLVKAGRFREDLLYRLNTVVITLPPLRERPEDIPLLAECFLARYGSEKSVTTLSGSALKVLRRYAWPGNVRELEHVIERAVALATHPVLSVDDLPPEVRKGGGSRSDSLPAQPGTLKELEQERLLEAYQLAQGNKAKTAHLLGISRRSLYRLLDRHGLGKKQSGPPNDATDPASQ